MTQASRDLKAAGVQRDNGFPEWACFIAQQSAEKGVKAVLQRWGAEAWGHSLVGLLDAIRERESIPDQVADAGRTLDRYYVPARYPNGYAAGTPSDYIKDKDAADAITSAETILRFCDGLLGGP